MGCEDELGFPSYLCFFYDLFLDGRVGANGKKRNQWMGSGQKYFSALYYTVFLGHSISIFRSDFMGKGD